VTEVLGRESDRTLKLESTADVSLAILRTLAVEKDRASAEWPSACCQSVKEHRVSTVL